MRADQPGPTAPIPVLADRDARPLLVQTVDVGVEVGDVPERSTVDGDAVDYLYVAVGDAGV